MERVMVSSAVPSPAREWLACTRRAYAAFWADDIARLVKPAARQLVHRYFDLLDHRERAMRRLRAEPETTGSTGQKVLNPSGTFLLNLESALSRMEAALGVDPASRARLKLDEITASDTLDRLFRRARGEEVTE
jgi:hypothetical protein